jgi:hypothetical protein
MNIQYKASRKLAELTLLKDNRKLAELSYNNNVHQSRTVPPDMTTTI